MKRLNAAQGVIQALRIVVAYKTARGYEALKLICLFEIFLVLMYLTKPHAAMKRLNRLSICWRSAPLKLTKPHAAMKRLNPKDLLRVTSHVNLTKPHAAMKRLNL